MYTLTRRLLAYYVLFFIQINWVLTPTGISLKCLVLTNNLSHIYQNTLIKLIIQSATFRRNFNPICQVFTIDHISFCIWICHFIKMYTNKINCRIYEYLEGTKKLSRLQITSLEVDNPQDEFICPRSTVSRYRPGLNL